ncbi:hypothetical protein GE115_11990 [Agromyces sp. CFH 90414]|uniref:Uncharacterized protein n=1 Tax=Agromyces agglutinans TaxID=2662258 RepID=A0A6I2F8C9_9MICO|nr:hypothetical protein [Agromyces agglutinans]MRG60581.1 hypothetical protein [Agromyces agglutinans]
MAELILLVIVVALTVSGAVATLRLVSHDGYGLPEVGDRLRHVEHRTLADV